MKAIIYCIDGLSPQYLMETIFYTGNDYQYKSLVLPTPICWTPVEWTCFSTGLTPKEHQVTQIRTDKLYTRGDIASSTFIWDDCDGAGLTIGIYHLPVCDTPPFDNPVVRFMVSGYSSYTFRAAPVTLEDHIDSLSDPHRFNNGQSIFPVLEDDMDHKLRIDVDWYREQCKYLTSFAASNIQKSFANFRRCIELHPVDVGIIYIHELDLVSHYFADIMIEDLMYVYEYIGGLIDGTNSRYNPDFHIVVSDHGIAPFTSVVPMKQENMIKCGDQFLRAGNSYPRYLQSSYHDRTTHGCFMTDKEITTEDKISLCNFRSLFRSMLE